MIKLNKGYWRFRAKMERGAKKRHLNSLSEVVVELDGEVIFRGHKDSPQLKIILKENQNAVITKGELRHEDK